MRLVALVLASSLVQVAAAAEPGMWLPQQLPEIAADLEAAGLELDPRKLADLTAPPLGAIVSLKGCSASFVSPDGLIVTNHHCVLGALQHNATPERDLITEGFLARKREDEIPARPDARVVVTTGIRDVTSQVLRREEARLADAARWRRVERHRKQIVAECEKPARGRRCQVKSFFGGERFLLFESLEIVDVRLVYAPALGVGNFGDEDDNWMWPRHTGDFGFYRAYVAPDGAPAPLSPRNVPYRPRHFMKISTRDMDPGDFMMVAGYPGVTHRLESAAEIAEAQEFGLPTSVRYRTALLAELRAAGESDAAVAIANASRIAALENYLKKHRGTLTALERDRLIERKREEEAAVRDRVPAFESLQAELARVLEARRATRERDTLLAWLDTASPMLSQAQKLVRLAHNRAKADRDRDEGFQERDFADLRAGMERSQRQIERGSDRRGLRVFLLETTRLPAGQRLEPLDRLLAARGGVDALLERVYAGTRMGDLERRRSLFQASVAELTASGDPMLELAVALWPVHAALDERDDEMEGALLRIRPRLIAARRTIAGGPLAPDANGTLRVTHGRVQGYAPRDGLAAIPQTTVAGILEKDTGKRPFDSPKRLLDMARAGEFGDLADPDLGTLPVNFLSTNSGTNGSSGSATLNAWGELAGLSFDTNLEAVSADYVYDPRWTRAIHVDARYMLWVMEAVDGATELLRELGRTRGKAGS